MCCLFFPLSKWRHLFFPTSFSSISSCCFLHFAFISPYFLSSDSLPLFPFLPLPLTIAPFHPSLLSTLRTPPSIATPPYSITSDYPISPSHPLPASPTRYSSLVLLQSPAQLSDPLPLSSLAPWSKPAGRHRLGQRRGSARDEGMKGSKLGEKRKRRIERG